MAAPSSAKHNLINACSVRKCPAVCVHSAHRVDQLANLHLELAAAHKLEGDDGSALLYEAPAGGRHGPWCDASHVCVVPPRGCEEDDLQQHSCRGPHAYRLGKECCHAISLGSHTAHNRAAGKRHARWTTAVERDALLLLSHKRWCTHSGCRKRTLPLSNTGVMTVMSGRWLPPASCGWLLTSTSPSCKPSASPLPPLPQYLVCMQPVSEVASARALVVQAACQCW